MAGTPRQQQAVDTHGISCVVTAGAGTGKTYVLVERYLAILRKNPGLSVGSILALTFTEKAAAEMRERIRTGLERERGERWERAQKEFYTAPIRTFHSFCAAVLREFAFEAGLEPSFSVLDEREAERIRTLSLERLFTVPGEEEGENDALVQVLVTVGEHDLGTMLRTLLSRREEAESFFARFSADPDGVFRVWEEVLLAARSREIQRCREDPRLVAGAKTLLSLRDRCHDPADRANTYLEEVAPSLMQILDPSSPESFLDAAKVFCSERLGNAGSAKNWGAGDLATLRQCRESLALLLGCLATTHEYFLDPSSALSSVTREFLRSMGVVFSRYSSLCDQEKAGTGALDFSDLVRLTVKLFREGPPDIAARFRSRFPFILIDESQDTDPAQYDIIAAIAGDPSPSLSGLFLVGDPKQSIYLFRGADVTRFRDAQEMVTGPCQGASVSLDVSFRSTPAVVSFVNHLFSQLFDPERNPFDFPYEKITVSDERTSHDGSITLLLSRSDEGVSEADTVADHIAGIFKEGIAVYEQAGRSSTGRSVYQVRPVRYGDMAILLEQRTRLGDYLHALRTRGIPYHVYSGTGFYRRQEIRDITSLIRFLAAPHDDIALCAILRSPWFGLSDADLYRISQSDGVSFLEKVRERGLRDEVIGGIYSHLSSWLARAGREMLAPFLRSLLLESGVIAVYGGMEDGEQILSNIGKMMEMARAAGEKGSFSLRAFADDLTRAIEGEEREGEAAILEPARDAVNIMTVHAAKGLEFPVVIIPEMGRVAPSPSPPLLMDRRGMMVGLRLPDLDQEWEFVPTPVYTLLKQELEKEATAERRRLFYVAMTRARDHIIMSGSMRCEQDLERDSTRLGWVSTILGITTEAIASGQITLSPAEDGPCVSVRIISPPASTTPPPPPSPPFSLPEETKGVYGRFTVPCEEGEREDYCGPLPVTHLVERLADGEGEPALGFAAGDCRSTYDRGALDEAVRRVMRGRDPGRVSVELGVTDTVETALLHRVNEEFSSLPEVQGSVTRGREISFAFTLFGRVLTGRIDLVLETVNGQFLAIVYKSDPLATQDLVRSRPYRIQLEIYRRAAEALGMGPAEAAIYAVRSRTLLHLPPVPDTELMEALEEGMVW